MKRIAVYAGSFDPVTVGHEDIIRRAAQFCDKLLVVVMYNVNKTGCFPVEDRVSMLRQVTASIGNVEVDAWDGLMVDYVRAKGAQFVVRGLRSMRDMESERDLAELNARLMPGLETVFLLSKPELGCISSSAVREAAHFHADFSSFVPACVYNEIKAHFSK